MFPCQSSRNATIHLATTLMVSTAMMFSGLCAKLNWEASTLSLRPEIGEAKAVGVYHFTNTGSNPVEIVEVKTDCACTAAKLDQTLYQPGDSGSIEVTFDAASKRGRQQRKVVVHTTDLENPEYTLNLEVEIQSVAKISKYMLLWRAKKAPEAKSIEIIPNDDFPIKEVRAKSTKGHFTEAVELLESGKYQLTLTPKGLESSLTDVIQLEISLVNGGQQTFWIHALIK